MTVPTDAYRFWIDMALECVRRDHTPSLSAGDQRGPFLTARALGMALAALHDANALATGGVPLLTVPGAPSLAGKKAIIAAAAACDELLRLRYPKQLKFLLLAWADWLELQAMSGTGASEQAGRQFGAAVNAIGINDATHAVLDAYTQTGAPYTHQRPAHEPMQHFAGGKWGGANALLVPVIGAFPPPPGRTSPATVVGHPSHKADFAAVATKGIDTRAAGTRTLHEEITGIFWGYDGPPELGTPPRLYMQVVLTILDNLQASNPGGLSPAEELRVIAGIGIAMADAAISAWYYKYSPQHMMWRPVVGIQKAPGNNGTAIPGWLPLGRPDTNGMGQWLTPDFPAYPSGHATFGGAAFQLLRLFLVQKGLATFKPNGTDDIDFDFVSDEYSGRNLDPRTMAPRPHMSRHYDSLWDAIVDNSISRVFLGVHWYFDGITTRSGSDDVFGAPAAPNKLGQTGGVWLGGQIANQIAPMIGISQATIIKSKMT